MIRIQGHRRLTLTPCSPLEMAPSCGDFRVAVPPQEVAGIPAVAVQLRRLRVGGVVPGAWEHPEVVPLHRLA